MQLKACETTELGGMPGRDEKTLCCLVSNGKSGPPS